MSFCNDIIKNKKTIKRNTKKDPDHHLHCVNGVCCPLPPPHTCARDWNILLLKKWTRTRLLSVDPLSQPARVWEMYLAWHPDWLRSCVCTSPTAALGAPQGPLLPAHSQQLCPWQLLCPVLPPVVLVWLSAATITREYLKLVISTREMSSGIIKLKTHY